MRNLRKLTDKVYPSFNIELTSQILENTPKTKYQYYTHELPPFIIRLIKKKRQMYREYRATEDPTMKSDINRFNKNIQQLIQEFKTHKWIQACENINEKKRKNVLARN